MRIDIPEQIARTAVDLHGAEGVGWLERLPGIVAELVDRWSLRLDLPFLQLSYNWAAPGRMANGLPVVLKVCYPDKEFYTEAEALRLYAGRGIVRLLDADMERGALLIEMLLPGTALESVIDDEQATHIAVEVMKQLWIPVTADHPFPTFSGWMGNMARKAPAMVEPHSAFPACWINRALRLHAELNDPAVEPVLLHGDLHQGNILRAGRQPWLAIDPKGVVGPTVCETGPLLINVLPPSGDLKETRRVLLRRTAQLAEELGMDLQALRAWGVVRAVLAGFWSLEDRGSGWDWTLRTAAALVT